MATKPNYCIRPDVQECIFCSLVNYGLDCQNNPVERTEEAPSKYQQVYSALSNLVPSEKTPHLDALEEADLLDALTVEQAAVIVRLMQVAYRNGQGSQGAEKIDSDAVWVQGVGAIERQEDGTWKLTMPDQPGAVAASVAAAAMRAIPSDARTQASRMNGKKGGRPRKDPANA